MNKRIIEVGLACTLALGAGACSKSTHQTQGAGQPQTATQAGAVQLPGASSPTAPLPTEASPSAALPNQPPPPPPPPPPPAVPNPKPMTVGLVKAGQTVHITGLDAAGKPVDGAVWETVSPVDTQWYAGLTATARMRSATLGGLWKGEPPSGYAPSTVPNTKVILHPKELEANLAPAAIEAIKAGLIETATLTAANSVKDKFTAQFDWQVNGSPAWYSVKQKGVFVGRMRAALGADRNGCQTVHEVWELYGTAVQGKTAAFCEADSNASSVEVALFGTTAPPVDEATNAAALTKGKIMDIVFCAL